MIEYDPEKNHDAISIIKQKDGNYKGYMFKLGGGVQPDGVVEVRAGDPNTVLLMLLTHDGSTKTNQT